MSKPSKADTWMPLYIADYLRDTMHLSREEHGAYLLLIMAAWGAGGRLPNKPRVLAGIAKATPAEWEEIAPTIMPFFTVEGDHLLHGRVVAEREKAVRLSEIRREIGAKGGRPRKQQESDSDRKSKPIGSANANLEGSQTETPSPSPSSDEERDANASLSPSGDDEGVCSSDEVREAFDAWNRMAQLCGLPVAEKLTDGRRRSIRKRLDEAGGLAGWQRALHATARSPHCRGKNDRKWKADLDFVCQAKSFTRLVEGFYGEGESIPRPRSETAPTTVWAGRADVREAIVSYWGEPFAVSWLDSYCRWRDLPTPAVTTTSAFVRDRLQRDAGRILADLGVEILLEAAA